ncbi:restriction endonuclease subunit S [Streptomyces sp. NPDC102490]|uniref:restriction endonuclease subunit S n=1 Tax=Streptomyces sp. NPDC102490 TaxID=3366183 RepID=UPI00381E8C5C
MSAVLPVKRLAEVALGKMVQPESKSPSDILAPYLRAAHIQPHGKIIDLPEQPMWFHPSELRVLDLRRGDVVIVEGGAGYGRSAVLSEDLPGWGFQNSIIRLRPLAGRADGRFLDYALQDALTRGRIDLVTSTATIPHFTADKVSKFEVSAPALVEQRTIADFLDRETAQIDALVSKQEEFIEYLRERRRAAIEAAVSEVGTRGPRLKHIVRSVRQGWSPQCYSWPADGIDSWAILKAGSVNGGLFRHMENKELPAEVTPRPRAVVQRGDLIVSRANTRDLVGSAAVVDGDFPRLMLSDKLYAFTLKEDQALPQFVAALLGSRKWRDLIEMRATGASSSMLNISQSDIVNLPMALPPVDEQRGILVDLDDQTTMIDALIAKAQEHIAFARERRAALITAAVNGQLDVRTARKAG